MGFPKSFKTKWTKRARVLAPVSLFALGACGGEPEVPDATPVQSRIQLESFGSCAELETYIEDTASLDVRTQLLQQKANIDQPFLWFGGGDVMATAGGQPPNAEAAGGARTASDSSGGSAAPKDYTKTNNQVAGVDEADFVKNDGTRIFVLSGQTLYINRSWPADTLTTTSTVTIEGWPREMFLDEKNRIVVFSQVYLPYETSNVGATDGSGGAARSSDIACLGLGCGYYSGNTTKVTVIDVADIFQPRVKNELYLPGGYQNGRRVGSSVRLVLNDSFRYPAGVKFYPDYEEGLYEDKGRLKAKYDELIVNNEKLIRGAKLTQWIPKGTRRLNGKIEDVDYNCSDFHKSNAPTKLGLLTVATVNLDSPNSLPTRTSVVAETGEVYATTQHLYVASQHWWWWPQPGQTDHTYLHKFDITNPDKAVYVASGGVEGHLLDQFSLDEHNGFLRAATTIASRVADEQNPENTWGRIETTNRVSVLNENAGALNVVGATPDIAKGERIFSARFVGDRGFVVTFRQVDPLFTLNLSNPSAPVVVGELKVPGFSTYIHPLGPNHLLTIGVHQPENGAWNERALKLSIFDVTDFAHPREAFTQIVGTAYSWSEALHEHKAFNYFPEKGLLAIPFSDWSYNDTGDNYWNSFTSDLRVFKVDALTGFSSKGALSMKDVYQSTGSYGWDYYWSPSVRRSVMADDFVYAISDAGLRVAHVASLGTPIKTVNFSRATP